ncbi:MAG: hypothetical protein WC458_03335 [Patescibacteria group bacterium]|jgi:hypothetical protein
MEVEHVCPKAGKPAKSLIIGNGTMERKEWKAKDSGLSGKELKLWKTIIVKCSFCGDNHEYALTMNP